MSELNQLYCPGCRCPRSIFQFPLKDGWRTATCGSCLERQALRYAAIQGREREGREGEGEGEGEGEQATGPQTRCSSCLQVRDLGRFLTCEPCRRRNLKAKRHRALITRVPNPSPTRAELADHIQRRQQATGKRERGFAGYRAITVDDYTREPTQEEEQELQDRQQQRKDRKAERRVWEVESKERVRESWVQRGQFLGEGEFEAWWEAREKKWQRASERLKEGDRERRKMKKDGEKWAEWAEREEQEKRGREEREEQEKREREGQACGLVGRQLEEIYIDEY